ncbi:Mercuric transport protein MerT precursor [Sphingopyxis sp. LC81]|jgi:mercuric ion transport protein|uniref:mercuric transporter MerT family protein n=1 Tax=Sphingopyxis sp. LC81 TaxID=1502850 RepID=UPI00050FF228|nr:mercuric transporter MerT family protein [Sphingopyxis sp. LC81]KGB55940.1 Mercuric transport protein MerT precursor [Sphingopyxis sp. LC81]
MTQPKMASRRSAWFAIAGGSLGALGAASCCIVPLVLFMLGVSGAWIGNLTALAPYQPIFLAVAIAFLAAGFWKIYRRPQAVCAADECGTPASNRLAKTALWLATALVGLAVLFPYLAPLFLEV